MMNSSLSIITRKTCRICNSSKLIKLYSLGNLYISNFVKPGQSGIKAPLVMVMCDQCKLVQLLHTAPQEILYARYYWYRSGVTDTMKKALSDITLEIERKIRLKNGDIVLDIGSNDGTLLRSYKNKKLIKVGVEPALNLKEIGSQGVDYFIDDFWEISSYLKKVKKKAKVITAIGMFYDMEDPGQFIKDISLALDKDGIFIAQLMCLKDMLDNNDVGNICHEHLEYYSLKTLRYLFEKNNLEIIDIKHNQVNGGSYRIFCRRKGDSIILCKKGASRVRYFFQQEKNMDKIKTHKDFFKRIVSNKRKTVNFIKNEFKKNKKIWVYGASTKGNTILQFFGLDNKLITGASDRSSDKWGKVTIGSNIMIFSEDKARLANPDYFLVMPYGFINEFVKREKQWLKNGGKFILPLPKFKII